MVTGDTNEEGRHRLGTNRQGNEDILKKRCTCNLAWFLYRNMAF